MDVLVTGSEGDVGSALLPQLAKRYDAVGFALRPPSGSYHVIQGDLTEYEQVRSAMQGMDAVVHMAALLCSPDQVGSVDLNVKATANVLQAALEEGVQRVIYCSTVWASGHGYTEPYQPIDEGVPCEPVCMYGVTKWMGELMTEFYQRQHALPTVVLRFCGFSRCRGYTPDGEIDWDEADIPGLFRRYLGDGFKLMNPVDLGHAFSLAVENPRAVGDRFVVGVYTPYVAADAAGLRSWTPGIVERYYPGVSKFLEEIGISIPSVPYYFNHEKARTRLGFRSQHDLGDLVRLYWQWKGE